MRRITPSPRLDHSTLRNAMAAYRFIREQCALGTLRDELRCAHREHRERRLTRTLAESMDCETDAHELARLLRIDPEELLDLYDSEADAVIETIYALADRLRLNKRGA